MIRDDIFPGFPNPQPAAVISGSGGWPFAHVLTVSTTDPDAQYATIAAANAAAAPGDVILLDAETYTLTATETLADANLTIVGRGPQATIITNSVASGASLYANAANITFRNLTIRHTGAGVSAGGVFVDASGLTLDNVIIEKTSGAPTVGYGLWLFDGTGHRLINGTKITVTTGTSAYGIRNTNATVTITVEGGRIEGTTQDIFGDQAGSSIDLLDPILANKLVSFSGTLEGWYFDASGHHYAASLSRLIWTPPSFRVHKNGTDQAGIVSGVATKLTWSTEDYDTHNWFTSDKFTPLLAGKYYIECSVYFNASTVGSLFYIFIYKNGAQLEYTALTSAPGTGAIMLKGISPVQANGSTDFFELYAQQQTGVNQDINGSPLVTHFSGIYQGQ